MKALTVQTPQDGFEAALAEVHENGSWVGPKREVLDFVVEIEKPQVEPEEWVIDAINEHHDIDYYDTASNWTFPENPSTNLKGYPTSQGEDGEYFQRLVDSPKGNQIESMVNKIEKWGRNNRTVAQVFRVDKDLNAMFPPCLIHIQAFYRQEAIHLSVAFRSHTLAKSYLGDIVSLWRLQKYLCEATGSSPGTLTVHSGSLHYRKENDEHELAEELYERFKDSR